MKDTAKAFLTLTPESFLHDTKLQKCSLAAQGLWLQLETMLHLAVPPGALLRADGTPMTGADIAREIKRPIDEVEALLDELEDANVLSIDDDGALFSWRIMSKKRLSEVRAVSGSKGGSKRKGAKADGSTQLGLTAEANDKANDKQATSKHLRSSIHESISSPQTRKVLLTPWEIWKRVWSSSGVYDGMPVNAVADTKAAVNIGKLVTSASELETLFGLYLSDTDAFLLKHGHALRWLQSRLPAYRRKMNSPHIGSDGVDRQRYEDKTRTVERRRFR